MAFVTVFFTVVNSARTVVLLKRTGHLLDLRDTVRGLGVLSNMLRKVRPLYRAYYRKGFHPDQHDNRAAVERAKSAYLGAKAA
jgi:uncharacterized protein